MNKISTFLRESSLARFLIPVSLILIIVSIIFLIDTIKNSNYIKKEAIVTKSELLEEAYTDYDGNHVDATYKIDIKYEVDGKEYKTILDGVSKYKEGEKITIYYNPDDPSKITQSKSIIIPIILLFSGIITLVVGIISATNTYKKNIKTQNQENDCKNVN